MADNNETPLEKLRKAQRAAHLKNLASGKAQAAAKRAKAKSEKPETMLQKLNRTAKQRGIEKNSEDSIEWFKDNARKAVGRERAQTNLLDQQKKARNVGKIQPLGKMFTYAYDPKWKDTLPYYDRFPLGFYLGPAKGGFYMINLHYLSPHYRAVMFDALMEIASSPKYSEKNKLKITYGILKGSEKLSMYKPCFKHYLVAHLRSKVVEIPYAEWEAALFLPTADFAKASASQVWSDSILGMDK